MLFLKSATTTAIFRTTCTLEAAARIFPADTILPPAEGRQLFIAQALRELHNIAQTCPVWHITEIYSGLSSRGNRVCKVKIWATTPTHLREITTDVDIWLHPERIAKDTIKLTPDELMSLIIHLEREGFTIHLARTC